jgi:hypothetical protein
MSAPAHLREKVVAGADAYAYAEQLVPFVLGSASATAYAPPGRRLLPEPVSHRSVEPRGALADLQWMLWLSRR